MKITNIGNFIKEVRLEFRHVNWLTRREVVNYTFVVVSLSIFLAAFLGLFDFIFNFSLVKFIF